MLKVHVRVSLVSIIPEENLNSLKLSSFGIIQYINITVSWHWYYCKEWMLQLLGYYTFADNNLLDSQLPSNLWLTTALSQTKLQIFLTWNTFEQQSAKMPVLSSIRIWDTWSLCIWYDDFENNKFKVTKSYSITPRYDG